MQSEWRRYLKESRALRAATSDSRAKCKTSLSRLRHGLADMGGQLARARVTVVQSYAMLAVIEKIFAQQRGTGSPKETEKKWAA